MCNQVPLDRAGGRGQTHGTRLRDGANGRGGSDGYDERVTTPTDPPRLLILSFSRIASDARVLKQVRLFSSRYRVTTCGYGPQPDGAAEHVEIPGNLAAWKLNRVATVLGRFRHAYRTQEVVAWARKNLRAGMADVILANDVETVGVALELRPTAGVHADLHEYAPRQKEQLWRWRYFVAPYLRWICRTHVTEADSWTTVAGGLARQYEKEFGFHPEVVINAAPFQELGTTATQWPPRLVHSGGAMRSRNLEMLIDAVARSSIGASLDMYLVPSDASYVTQLRERARELAPDRIRIHDPLPYDELHSTLGRFDIGLYCPPRGSFNLTNALPNKLFDFVQGRLALVISPNPEMRALVEDYELGWVTDGYGTEDLVKVLDALTLEQIDGAKNASDAAAEPLGAERQMDAWVSAVDALARRLSVSA